MLNKLRTVRNDQYWDYFILVARFLLGWTFLRYGYGKLDGGQFGLTEVETATQVQDLSLFRLAWFLFDHQPFKAIVGLLQILCGLLLLINRTAIIGAIMFLPLVTTILLIDLTVMPSYLVGGFAWRLSSYLLLDLLILWHYKEKMIIIWDAMSRQANTKFSIPAGSYLLLPVMAIGLEVAIVLPKILLNTILYPTKMMKGFEKVPELMKEVIAQISN